MISEPMTLATDYLLGGVSLWIAFKVFRISRFWALGFTALSIAAFLGGTWHGFFKSDALWKATTLAVGVASFGMLAGSARAVTSGLALRALTAFAALKLVAYCAWMLFHDDFIWVVADTGASLAIIAALYLWRFNGWMLAGVAVSVAAGAVQASGFALHLHLNHNDLYHVVQIAALLLFYKGLAAKR
ncbi:MAG: hypothetical protein A3G81_08165 [Betaproteobacteria bacterium RIFCSPLOWO2_12_FULL_65_14]|nr:MAG: hypothetical protein A3G81_08165 [Betaproteobacteria bacterium RIFCSPLOWO2_12_FULL_65_14]